MQLIKSFDISLYNERIIELEKQIEDLNSALGYLKEWTGVEITNDFFDYLTDNRGAAIEKILSRKKISKHIFDKYNIKPGDSDNPNYSICTNEIFETCYQANQLKSSLYKLIDFIEEEHTMSFTIQNEKAVIIEGLEEQLMRECCQFASTKAEKQRLIRLQQACEIINEFRKDGMRLYQFTDLFTEVHGKCAVNGAKIDNISE